MSILKGLNRQILKIDEGIIDTSLSINALPTTERIALVKYWNNQKKYEHRIESTT
jgi:hypothetical protein